MTDPTIALKQYLSNIGLEDDVDFLQEAMRTLSQMLMELEVEQENTNKLQNGRTIKQGLLALPGAFYAQRLCPPSEKE